MLLRTADTARETLWLVYEANGKHCSLYLLQNDERVERREATPLHGWMEDTASGTDFAVLPTFRGITSSSPAISKRNALFKNARQNESKLFRPSGLSQKLTGSYRAPQPFKKKPVRFSETSGIANRAAHSNNPIYLNPQYQRYGNLKSLKMR